METVCPRNEFPYPSLNVTREEVLTRMRIEPACSKYLSYEEAKGEIERERKAEWKRVHDLYLQSDQWRAIRSRVLDRAKGLCEGCRLATAEQVHHHTYDNAGHEFMFELAALCAPCHERYHASKRRRRSWS